MKIQLILSIVIPKLVCIIKIFHYIEGIFRIMSILVMLLECRFLDTDVDSSNPGISMFVSLSKTLYPHCFCRLSCEMSAMRGQPWEGCSML